MESQSIDFDPWREAQSVIAQGCLTNSKSPHSHVYGIYPTHVTKGSGCYLFDVTGKRYVDYICGLGANLVGYGNQTIVNAMTAAAKNGLSHSLPTLYEIDAAKAIQSIVPWVNRVKFLKTGSEACNASLIIARAFTSRSKILSNGYHGFGAEFTSLTPPALGCPDTGNIEMFESLSQIDESVAAVIIEPILLEDSIRNRKYLKELRSVCDKTGALLIFDEIITGMRVPKLTVSEYYKTRPDILLLGKAIAGGAALSAVCGHSDIMDEKYFVSSTFAGETSALAACVATIDLVCTKPDYSIDALWRAGGAFLDEFNSIWPEGIRIEGYQSRGRFIGEPLTKALFFQEMCRAGVLFGPSWFYNVHLEKEQKNVMMIARDVIAKIMRGVVSLEGEMPASPFAMKVRESVRNH